MTKREAVIVGVADLPLKEGKVLTPMSVLQAQALVARDALDRKSTRLNSSHIQKSRMPSSA